MTKEEILNGLYDIKSWHCNGNSEMYRTIAEAIKVLEQEPCEDVISRQAAIDAFERFIHELGIEDKPYNYGEMALSDKNVPPVNPQPKMGHWEKLPYKAIEADGTILFSHVCDSCRGIAYFRKSLGKIVGGLFCPNCGARMEESEE